MLDQHTVSLALACAAMALLTFIVAVRLFVVRVAEMRLKRISPRQIATSTQVAAKLESVQASDNFRNLFETPVLFYVLCALLAATGLGSTIFVIGAWVYVVLRAAHSFIQCTYNRVMHRFRVFAASLMLLFALWAWFGVVLWGQSAI